MDGRVGNDGGKEGLEIVEGKEFGVDVGDQNAVIGTGVIWAFGLIYTLVEVYFSLNKWAKAITQNKEMGDRAITSRLISSFKLLTKQSSKASSTRPFYSIS